jgi:hypothetical protein
LKPSWGWSPESAPSYIPSVTSETLTRMSSLLYAGSVAIIKFLDPNGTRRRSVFSGRPFRESRERLAPLRDRTKRNSDDVLFCLWVRGSTECCRSHVKIAPARYSSFSHLRVKERDAGAAEAAGCQEMAKNILDRYDSIQ